MNTADRIEETLTGMRSLGLEEAQSASLMRRKDNKYLFSFRDLPDILNTLGDHYRVLEIGGLRSHRYETVYYDTPDRDMYHMHHRGRVNRHKVRFRHYTTSGEFFLEVKHKDARSVTRKKRILSGGPDAGIQPREETFLSDLIPYAADAIGPVLENSFQRITLVRDGRDERITLDFGLGFRSRMDDSQGDFPGIAVAEIKYQGHLAASPVHYALRQAHITPRRFSKYCIGMAMLHPSLKQNLFKEKTMRVHRINTNYLTNLNN